MIITELLGGLGNQMFQYAFGRQMAILNSSELFLGLTKLNNRDNTNSYTFRELELSIFNIEINIYQQKAYKNLFDRIKQKLFPMKEVQNWNFSFTPKYFKLSGDMHLHGWWQNEDYFKGIESIIRKDFVFKPIQDSRNLNMQKIVLACEAVSVHYRRGDYITNSSANAFHGLCNSEYYELAFEYINSNVENPVFFIFSDEPDWVRQNVPMKYPHYFVDFNEGKSSYEDMRLMSRCKHNIIANSSFSWWGAWLNSNSDKIVIAPQNWFSQTQTDIVPHNWKRL